MTDLFVAVSDVQGNILDVYSNRKACMRMTSNGVSAGANDCQIVCLFDHFNTYASLHAIILDLSRCHPTQEVNALVNLVSARNYTSQKTIIISNAQFTTNPQNIINNTSVIHFVFKWCVFIREDFSDEVTKLNEAATIDCDECVFEDNWCLQAEEETCVYAPGGEIGDFGCRHSNVNKFSPSKKRGEQGLESDR